MQSPLTRMLWRLKTLCRWRGGVCSEFTGDGYSIGLVSVGELAHRPSGTYSGEAQKHGHEDKARRETVSGYTLSTNKRCTSTMGASGPALRELMKSGTWAIPRPRLEDTAERQTQLLAGSQHWHWGLPFISQPSRQALHAMGPHVLLTDGVHVSSFGALERSVIFHGHVTH